MKKDYSDLIGKLFVLHDVVFENGTYWVVQKWDGLKVVGSCGVSKSDALQRVMPKLIFDRNNQIIRVVI